MSFDKQFFSLPFLGSVGAMLITVGMSYAALTAADEAQKTNTEALKLKQGEISRDVQDVKIGLATVRANQDNQAEKIEQVRDDVKQIRADIQQILRELRN